MVPSSVPPVRCAASSLSPLLPVCVPQVTTSLPPMHYQQVLKALGFKEFQVPLHLALMDASGDAALIEYTAKGVSGGRGAEEC